METIPEAIEKRIFILSPRILEEKGARAVKDWYYAVGSATGIISIALLVYTMGWTLGALQTKTDILWQNYTTRTGLYEKLFVELAAERMKEQESSAKYTSYLSASFISEMKTDKVKQVLDSNLPQRDKVFSVIDKIGGLDNLTTLLGIESSIDAMGVLACFVEDYPLSPE